MNYLECFYETMDHSPHLALATSEGNLPNVRIMDFVYDKEKNIVYISAFKGTNKIGEFKKNEHVSFTTIPHNSQKHVRSIDAKVTKSELTVFDVAENFIVKNPNFKFLLENASAMLELYEIKVARYNVIVDPKNSETITVD